MKEKQEVPFEKGSALEKHIRYFGGSDVSYSSMAEKNDELGLSWFQSRKTAALVALGGGTKVSGCPFSTFKPKNAVGVLNHPQSTGIYNLDGSINEERWEELLQYAEKNDSDELIITEPQIYNFLNSCRARETRPDPLGIAKQASDGEWATYMQVFTEKNSEGVRFVKIQSLRDFFEDSQIPGHEVEERHSKTL